jgi:hypothetical protein
MRIPKPDTPLGIRRKDIGGNTMAHNAPRSGKLGSAGTVQPLIVAGALVIVALVGVIIALALRPPVVVTAEEEELPPQRSVVVNEDNVGNIVDDLFNEEPVQVGYYEARMSTTWLFTNGTTAPSIDAYVENVPNNTHDVYFDVVLADTDETIYESPVIPRGSHLDNIALDKELDAGDHEAIVIYHLIDEQQRTVSTLRMAITIRVS